MTAVFVDEKELGRQRALDALGVLDTAREDRFDRITALARTIFQIPLSTVTLIDHDRAWFKSCAGGDFTEAPRSETFCAHTVVADEPVVVADVTLDPRFADLPSVTGPPHLRFYAGFPVRDSFGTAVGTFCLYDTQVRHLDQHQLDIMAELTACVQTELISSHDVARAQAVQQSLLPKASPAVVGYESAAFCRPAASIAGDFFDHQDHGDWHAFAVADVMGKGPGAAIIMASTRAVLRSEYRALAAGRFGPDGTMGDVLTEVNSILLEDLASSGSFVTGFFGWADPSTGTIRFVDAGHGLAVVVRADGTAEQLASNDLPLGVSDDWRWTERTVELGPGDDLVCFSDGLLDLMGGTLDALPAIIQVVEGASGPREIVDRISRLADAEPLGDDVTVLAVRRLGAP